jgi:GT2 family glycosyltransferase
VSEPFVRVVVLNWNGGALLSGAVAALLRTEWPPDRLQIVVVDNDSSDGSDLAVERSFPGVEVRRTGANLGFPGNNRAMGDRDGVDYIALVNNDAFVEPGWLRPLVEALESDPGLGAASPKMVFAPRFCAVELEAPTFRPGGGDQRELSVRVSGLEVDGVDLWRHAWFGRGCHLAESGRGPEASFRWLAGRATIGFPLLDGAVPPVLGRLRLSAPAPVEARIRVGERVSIVTVDSEPSWVDVKVSGTLFDVVQNAGSVFLQGGYGADRGFLQRDEGQLDSPADVWAWCGGAALLRSAYLADVGLFWDPFFLYYEDTDLAWRGRARGWRYTCQPASVVRHLHGMSAGEGSPVFQHYVERNRLLLLARNAPAGLAARTAGRYLLTAASLVRRDLVTALRTRRPPRFELPRRRLRSFAGFVRLMPRVVIARRRLRRRQVVPDEELLAWLQPRSSHPA